MVVLGPGMAHQSSQTHMVDGENWHLQVALPPACVSPRVHTISYNLLKTVPSSCYYRLPQSYKVDNLPTYVHRGEN